MCLIVDVNVVPNMFFSEDDPDFQAIHNALFKPHTLKAKLAYGGKLTIEYGRMPSMLRLLRALDAQGSTIPVDDHLVNAEEEHLIALGICKSNG